MTEPKRWLDDPETPARLREVLTAAPETPRLPAEMHRSLIDFSQQVAAGIAVAGGAAAATQGSTVGKALASLIGLKAGTKVIIGSGVLGVMAATSYVATRPTRPAPAASATHPCRSPGPLAPSCTLAPDRGATVDLEP